MSACRSARCCTRAELVAKRGSSATSGLREHVLAEARPLAGVLDRQVDLDRRRALTKSSYGAIVACAAPLRAGSDPP